MQFIKLRTTFEASFDTKYGTSRVKVKRDWGNTIEIFDFILLCRYNVVLTIRSGGSLTKRYYLFQDRHVKNSSKDPQMDSSQDYCLLLGYENKTHTVLRFSRRYDTCDPRDLKITVGCLIYTTSGVKDNSSVARSARPRNRLMDLWEKLSGAACCR